MQYNQIKICFPIPLTQSWRNAVAFDMNPTHSKKYKGAKCCNICCMYVNIYRCCNIQSCCITYSSLTSNICMYIYVYRYVLYIDWRTEMLKMCLAFTRWNESIQMTCIQNHSSGHETKKRIKIYFIICSEYIVKRKWKPTCLGSYIIIHNYVLDVIGL